MKIFVLGTRGFPGVQGGVEKHCENLYTRIAKFGCEVFVFCRTPYFDKKERKNEYNGVRFIYLWTPKSKYFEAILHTFLGVIVSRIKSANILHIHAIGPGLFTPLAKILGLKVVVTNHGPDYERKKWNWFAKLILKLGEMLSTRFADKVITISYTTKKYLEQKYNRKDIFFIPNGISFDNFASYDDVLKKYNLKKKKYVLTVSRFTPEKGLDVLINAYRRLENPEFKLVIVGDADHKTEYSESLKKLAKQTEGVVLTGVVTGKTLAELYANAGLFVLPSYYEGLPIVLLEALSYGLPVLVSDIEGNRQVPLKEFRYFTPGDVNQLAGKMVELYKKGIDEEEKNFYLKILKENYNWDNIAAEIFKIYVEVLNYKGSQK